MKNSFQIVIKLKTVRVTSPGWARGNMIFQKVLIDEQPSIAADSSYEKLKFLKKAYRKKTAKGTFMLVYKNIIKKRLLIILKTVARLNRGMMIIITGIPRAAANMF
jgi:hypothetical protein